MTDHGIPHELIYSWDYTGLNYVPVSNWTMEVSGSKKVPIVGLDDKRRITCFRSYQFKITSSCFSGSRLVRIVTANYEISSKTATCFTLHRRRRV